MNVLTDSFPTINTSTCRDGIWAYFISKCLENLHIVLTMSPSGNTLRNYCNNFPGLVGNTTIDWIFPWPEEALMSVAQISLKDSHIVPREHLESIMEHIVYVHTTLNQYVSSFQQCLKRDVYVTPKHYLDFIHLYRKLLGKVDDERSLICWTGHFIYRSNPIDRREKCIHYGAVQSTANGFE